MSLLPVLGIALVSGGIARAGQSAHFDDPKLDRVWGAQLWELTPSRSAGAPALGPTRGSSAPRPGAPVASTARPPAPGTSPGRAAAPHAAVVTRKTAEVTAEVSRAALAKDDVHGPTASVKAAAAPIVPENPAAAEAPRGGPWPYRPRLKLAYRRFSLGALGASSSSSSSSSAAAASSSGSAAAPSAVTGAAESFESLSLDFYPISGYLRAGTSTQFGWQSGQFDRSGDYFLAQSLTSGIQFPGRITPFAEVLAGAGYMRRAQVDAGSLPGAYFQVGLEAGIELYMAGRAYTSIAVGYMHTGNLLVVQQTLTSIKQDSWALKVGVGI